MNDKYYKAQIFILVDDKPFAIGGEVCDYDSSEEALRLKGRLKKSTFIFPENVGEQELQQVINNFLNRAGEELFAECKSVTGGHNT